MTANRPTFHRALWLVQWALSTTFFLEGLLKLALSEGDLPARLAAAAGSPPAALALAGAVEVVLALALVLPAATGFFPSLTPVGAGCVVLAVASGALGAGLPFGSGHAAADLLAVAAAALVAWGRVAVAPVAPLALGPEPVGALPPALRPTGAARSARRPAREPLVGRDSNPGSIAA